MPRPGYKPPLPYSKVVRALWNDADFRELSAPQPNAQTLWLRLLTGPELRAVPGLLLIGEAGLAEALDWPLDVFRDVFREVVLKGWVQANWKARVIWVPKAIRYNLPESTNVIKGWALPWAELPNCDLKKAAYPVIQEAVSSIGSAFRDAFRQCIPNPSGDPSGESSRKPPGKSHRIQEQEQEQEQELNKKQGEARKDAPPAAALSPEILKLTGEINLAWPELEAEPGAVVAWTVSYAGVDLLAETPMARSHWISNAENRKPQDTPRAFLNRWFKNAKRGAPAGSQLPIQNGNGRKGYVPLTGTKERFKDYDDGDPLGLNLQKPPKEPPRG